MDVLNPGAVRAALDAKLGAVDRRTRAQWNDARRSVVIVGGHTVTNDARPGYLVLNGRPCYSAAWL